MAAACTSVAPRHGVHGSERSTHRGCVAAAPHRRLGPVAHTDSDTPGGLHLFPCLRPQAPPPSTAPRAACRAHRPSTSGAQLTARHTVRGQTGPREQAAASEPLPSAALWWPGTPPGVPPPGCVLCLVCRELTLCCGSPPSPRAVVVATPGRQRVALCASSSWDGDAAAATPGPLARCVPCCWWRSLREGRRPSAVG